MLVENQSRCSHAWLQVSNVGSVVGGQCHPGCSDQCVVGQSSFLRWLTSAGCSPTNFTRTAKNEDKIPSYGSYYTTSKGLGCVRTGSWGLKYQGVEVFWLIEKGNLFIMEQSHKLLSSEGVRAPAGWLAQGVGGASSPS